MIYPFSMGARVVYLDRPPTASALMPALRAIRPTVMLIVPLIIEKIYRHQVLAKFNSNGFWRTLYKVGFLRRYLHRVAGKKLLKLFGGRLRFLGIGGAKLDGGAEKSCWRRKCLMPSATGSPRPRRCLRAPHLRRCASARPGPRRRACSCAWSISTPHPAGARSWRCAQRHARVFQEPRGDERGLYR